MWVEKVLSQIKRQNTFKKWISEMHCANWYFLLCTIQTRNVHMFLYFVLLWLCYISWILFIYLPMFSGLFVWTRSNRMVASVPVKQPENHDDVINWKHFARYWPFVRGIHRSPVTSPHKGQWRGALMFTLICARINGWGVRREAGDLAWGVRLVIWDAIAPILTSS